MTSWGMVPSIWNTLPPKTPGPMIWKKRVEPLSTYCEPMDSRISYTTIRNSSPHTLSEHGRNPYVASHVTEVSDSRHGRKEPPLLPSETRLWSWPIERLLARWLARRRTDNETRTNPFIVGFWWKLCLYSIEVCCIYMCRILYSYSITFLNNP